VSFECDEYHIKTTFLTKINFFMHFFEKKSSEFRLIGMKKEKQSFVVKGISRKTRKLFDRSIKFIIVRTLIHLIKGFT